MGCRRWAVGPGAAGCVGRDNLAPPSEGVGVCSTCVDRLVADCVALSVGGSIHGEQCATRILVYGCADLAGSVPLGQIQQSHGGEGPYNGPTGASSGGV